MLYCVLALLVCQALSSVSARKGHLEHYGEQGIKLPVEEVNGWIPPLEFYKDYQLKGRPVVMRGAFDSPAMTKWTDEYFVQNAEPSPKGDVLVELHKIQPLKQKVTYMHLKKFMAEYNSSNYYIIDFVPDSMKKDVVMFFPLQCKSYIYGGMNTNMMWFSSGGTRGIIHVDPYQNMLCQMRGKKHFVFLNMIKHKWILPLLLDHPGHSSVDVDKIDLNRWPFLEGLEYLHADVNPGDCIFIPFGSPHQVRSYGDSNLAVSLWYYSKNNTEPKDCLKKEDRRVTFDKVLWMENVNRSRVEAKNVIFTFWQVGLTEKSRAVPVLAMGNPHLMNNPAFVSTVNDLFDSADVVTDGRIDEKDDAKKLTLKEMKRIVKAIENYNKVVFVLRERPVKSYLPKYFFQYESRVFNQDSTYAYLHYKYDVEPEEIEEEEAKFDDDDDVVAAAAVLDDAVLAASMQEAAKARIKEKELLQKQEKENKDENDELKQEYEEMYKQDKDDDMPKQEINDESNRDEL